MKKYSMYLPIVFSFLLFSNFYSQITENYSGRCSNAKLNNYVSGDYINLQLPSDGSPLNLKFYVDQSVPPTSGNIDRQFIIDTFEWAVNSWSAQVNNIFTATEVTSESQANIKIYWVSRSQNQEANALSTFPGNSQWGQIAFTEEDDDLKWYRNTNYIAGGANRKFEAVMLHEVGHILGLCHNNLNSVMKSGQNLMALTPYDIQNIRMEYMPVTLTNIVTMPSGVSTYYGGKLIMDDSILSISSEFSTSPSNVFHKKVPSFREEKSGNISQLFNDTILHLTAFDNQYIDAEKRNSKFSSWKLDAVSIENNLSVDKKIAFDIYDPLHQFDFVANHDYKWNIFINGNTELDGTTQISRTPLAKNESGYITANDTKTVSGKTLYFGGWENDLTYNTNTWQDRSLYVTATSDQTYTALYKYKQHTTSTNAITSPSQRRYAYGESIYGGNTEDIVYTSNGNAWHEYNYNNNGWVVRKIGTSGATSPTVAQNESGDQSAIVYQQGTQLRLQVYMHSVYLGHFLMGDYLITNTNQTGDLTPTVVFQDGKILVAFRIPTTDPYLGAPGIYYKFIEASDGSVLSGGIITNTGSTWKNPSLAIDRNSSLFKAHLVFDHSLFNKEVFWTTLTNYSGNTIAQLPRESVSNGTSFLYNEKASVIVADNGMPIVVWNAINGNRMILRTCLRTRNTNGSWSSTIREFGNNATNGSVQRASSNDEYIIGWMEGTSVKYAKNSNFTATSTGISGYGLQLATGSTRNYIKMLTLGTDTYHTFTYKTGLGKSSAASPNYARKGTITFDNASFYYMIADLMNNDEPIEFVELSEDDEAKNYTELNSLLETKPFTVSEGDRINFSISYGNVVFNQSKEVLDENDIASFKVELVEADGEVVLDMIDKVSFTRKNFDKEKEISYRLKIKDLGTKTVKLRLIVESSSENNFTLSSISANSEFLAKTSNAVEEIYIDRKNSISNSFQLMDNYPNPFNPTTTIEYTIPAKSNVQLKVFDTLGREIAVLVNGIKPQGKYVAEFNASALPSGVYLYTLRAGNYIKTNKMLLLK